jgi:DNA-directed RNA polymerase specialized sigma24 family protein
VRVRLAHRSRRRSTEEIVQEVFFRIWMHGERLLSVESLSGYLYAVTRNVSLNRIARAQTASA